MTEKANHCVKAKLQKVEAYDTPSRVPSIERGLVSCFSCSKESIKQTPYAASLFLCNPGAFIVCWLPFFLTHVLNTHCQACHVSPELYRATTWLGYVNSALNPVIYTTFNVEFRKAFLKILSC